jgi:hypothetical protein
VRASRVGASGIGKYSVGAPAARESWVGALARGVLVVAAPARSTAPTELPDGASDRTSERSSEAASVEALAMWSAEASWDPDGRNGPAGAGCSGCAATASSPAPSGPTLPVPVPANSEDPRLDTTRSDGSPASAASAADRNSPGVESEAHATPAPEKPGTASAGSKSAGSSTAASGPASGSGTRGSRTARTTPVSR